MWFIQTYDEDGNIGFLNAIFTQKHEAAKHVKKELLKDGISDAEVKHIEKDFICGDVSIGDKLFVVTNGNKSLYGVVIDITNTLVEIELTSDNSKDTALFTKSRINKEIINGRFVLDKA